MTMDHSSLESVARESNPQAALSVSSTPSAATPGKRSFDVAFLIDKKTKFREDADPLRRSPPSDKTSDPSDEPLCSAFQKVAKTSLQTPSGPTTSDLGYPLSFPAIATTLSLQLLQQTTAAKNLAMSFLNPASSALINASKTYPLVSARGCAESSFIEDYIRAQAAVYQEKPRLPPAPELALPAYPFTEPARVNCSTNMVGAPMMAGFSPAQNVCAKCNLSFRMTSDLVYHMRSQHRKETDPVRQKRQEKLRCPVCGEAFRERHHLTRHMTSHEDRELEAK